MISIYILEDDPKTREQQVSYVHRYAEEKKLTVDVKSFDNAYDLLENYKTGGEISSFSISRWKD